MNVFVFSRGVLEFETFLCTTHWKRTRTHFCKTDNRGASSHKANHRFAALIFLPLLQHRTLLQLTQRAPGLLPGAEHLRHRPVRCRMSG